jgi:hypothetical protein
LRIVAAHHDEASFAERFLAKFRNLATGYAKRRMKRELREYDSLPETRVAPFFRRTPRGDSQVFRSLVQINFYPRPRTE